MFDGCSVMPLQDEERLFIEAIRDLNYQASRLQSEERIDTSGDGSGVAAGGAGIRIKKPALPRAPLSAAQTDVLQTPLISQLSAEKGGSAEEEVARKSTSFNPYHGPSFITAIPDSNTPYISSMCIIDASDRLDSATSLVIDAAMRLNHSSAAHAPNLHSIVSWVNHPVAVPSAKKRATGSSDSAPPSSCSGDAHVPGGTQQSATVQLSGTIGGNRPSSGAKFTVFPGRAALSGCSTGGVKRPGTLQPTDSDSVSGDSSSGGNAKQRKFI